MNLRPFQAACVEAIAARLRESASTLFVLPTGTGKTVIFSHVAKEFIPRGRVMVLAHRLELIEQAAAKIQAITGIMPEVEMGQRWANEEKGFFGKAPVVVSSIQTQIAGSRGAGRMSRFDPAEFSLVIVDEAHHATAKSYRKVIDHYRQNADLKLLGCTATPDRADEEALGHVFDSVSFEYSILDAVQDGWLVPIRQRIVNVKNLDFSSVRTTAGDLNGADLSKVLEEEEHLHGIADPLYREAGNRTTLVFAVTVRQAERLAEILNRHAAGCAMSVSQHTPDFMRREIFEGFSDGKFRFLVNVGIATEGYDCPRISCVALARPTKSRSLYAQMIGRGTRPLAGILDSIGEADGRRLAIATSEKPALEVIDFTGICGKHKLIHATDILGGNYSDEVIERANKIAGDRTNAVPVRDVLEEAKRQLAIEKARADEAAKRKSIVGRSNYTTKSIDPFAALDLQPATKMPPGRFQFQLSAKQKSVLEKQGIDHENLPIAQSIQVLNEIFRRWDQGLCSIKQARLLKRYGYGADTTKEQAGRILNELAANGWKPLRVQP